MRSRISRAALLVKVTASDLRGRPGRSSRMWARRVVSTRVLPVPAPASTSTGPSTASTAWRCAFVQPVEIQRLGRAISRGGGARRSSAGDQAHALSHVGRHGARRGAGGGRAARQAGGGDRRAQGALRRDEQHLVGAAARGRRRSRRVRLSESQDAREDGARRPPRDRRHSPLRAPRKRQLQFSHGASLYRCRVADVQPVDRRRRERSVQLAHRLFAPATVSQARRRAGEHADAVRRADRARSRARRAQAGRRASSAR